MHRFRTGEPVAVPDIAAKRDTWPESASANDQGFGGVFAIPLRLRSTTIGAMNLFRAEPGDLNERDLRAAQALADVATIGILHQRSFRANDVAGQLQVALNSRVLIEQAKGVIAHRHSVDMDEAFRILRTYTRTNRARLVETARASSIRIRLKPSSTSNADASSNCATGSGSRRCADRSFRPRTNSRSTRSSSAVVRSSDDSWLIGPMSSVDRPTDPSGRPAGTCTEVVTPVLSEHPGVLEQGIPRTSSPVRNDVPVQK